MEIAFTSICKMNIRLDYIRVALIALNVPFAIKSICVSQCLTNDTQVVFQKLNMNLRAIIAAIANKECKGP